MSSPAGSDSRATAGARPGGRRAAPGQGGIVMGVVRTGPLLNSAAASRADARAALAILPGEPVRTFERPIPHAVSPDVLAGVDCELATRSGRGVRAVGTVLARASVTGGRVLQGSAFTHAAAGSGEHRQPWSHYLSRPGSVETIGKADWADVAAGFLVPAAGPRGIALGSLCDQVLDTVQRSGGFDRRPPFRAGRTTLRWVLEPAEAGRGEHVEFAVGDGTDRLVRLTLKSPDRAAVAGWCEDLAPHDWLLTTVTEMISRGRLGEGAHAQVIDRIRPAVDQLLHLWMPGVRVDRSLMPLWTDLDQKVRFQQQWQNSIDRIRDQLALHTLTLLGSTAGG
ncbi:SCO2521 family protein [Actinomadura nitritigenes]|uniref:SCO2521 family protein n=1 Tax=Actinomadura nitritigenes TaxID=134602 RepID=UPI003D91FA6C